MITKKEKQLIKNNLVNANFKPYKHIMLDIFFDRNIFKIKNLSYYFKVIKRYNQIKHIKYLKENNISFIKLR